MQTSSPERARALIEQTVLFTGGLGFAPCEDFHKAFAMFGDVDASQCTEVFPMGDKDGKPMYISGPFDDFVKQRAIMARLAENAGEGNFNFVVATTGSELSALADFAENDEESDMAAGALDEVDAVEWRRLE